MNKNFKKQRPINLNLITIKFPITAISSITHRISGVISFFTVGFCLWLLGISLESPDGFLQATYILKNFFVKFMIWNMFSMLIYHIISGIRYILMDFGYLPETLTIANRSSKACFLITTILAILLGVLIW